MTSVAFVAEGSTSGNSTASGSPANVLSSAPPSGSQVLLNIAIGSLTDSVASISSAIGTFFKCGADAGLGQRAELEQWVCFNASGSGIAVTVTTTSGNEWQAQAMVVSGAIACSPSIGLYQDHSATIETPSINAPTGSLIVQFVTTTSSEGAEYGGSSPWVDTSDMDGYNDVAYCVVTSGGSITPANWAQGGGFVSGVITLVFYPNVTPLVVNPFISPNISSVAYLSSFTGTGYFLVPVGVATVNAECWAAGGGGGNSGSTTGGSGGGGGEFAQEASLSVTAGALCTFTIGNGGTGVIPTAGGNSTFVGVSVTVTAHGGAAGVNGGTGVAGGTGSSNTIHFNGGASGNGENSVTRAGGGGGSSAGTAAAGNAGTAATTTAAGVGGTAPTGGGPGGNGGRAAIGSAPASSPGGGGGGSGGITSGSGGSGAFGQVSLTWTVTSTFAAKPVVLLQAVQRASNY